MARGRRWNHATGARALGSRRSLRRGAVRRAPRPPGQCRTPKSLTTAVTRGLRSHRSRPGKHWSDSGRCGRDEDRPGSSSAFGRLIFAVEGLQLAGSTRTWAPALPRPRAASEILFPFADVVRRKTTLSGLSTGAPLPWPGNGTGGGEPLPLQISRNKSGQPVS